MMRVGLRVKLLGVTLGLLAFITLGVLRAVHYYIGQQVRQQAEQRIEAGVHVLTSILERTQEQLLGRGRILVELPSLRTGLTEAPDQLEPLLQEITELRAANLLWATDPGGTVLASTADYPPIGEVMAGHRLTATAIGGTPALGFDFYLGDWWLLLCMPVKDPESAALLGTVTLALMVGQTYLDRLAELVKTPVGFLWDGHQFWSLGWPEGVREQIAVHAPGTLNAPPQEVVVDAARRYLWLARPLHVGIPASDVGPVALVGIHVDESLIQQMARAIGWIAAIAMGVGALILVGAIRSVTRPLKQLVTDSQRVGAGDLSHRSQVRGRDEVAELAQSFNQMVENLERSQQELIQSEKMASLGQLAAGVAHELKNPLGIILQGSEYLNALKTYDPADVKKSLEHITYGVLRADKIVRGLLDFARPATLNRKSKELNDVVSASLALVEKELTDKHITVQRDLTSDSTVVLLDEEQIQEVLVNLFVNSVQAMEPGGCLSVRTFATTLTDVGGSVGSRATDFFKPGDPAVVCEVADTGSGIPKDQLKNVFDPFFTTKPAGQGTGLGLSITRSIVEAHRGLIRLTSQEGHGTTMSVTLPAPTGTTRD